jgi:hypothetical protein
MYTTKAGQDRRSMTYRTAATSVANMMSLLRPVAEAAERRAGTLARAVTALRNDSAAGVPLPVRWG